MSIIRCCRSCKSTDLKDLFSLGNQAFTGIFLKKNTKIPHGKLDLVICNTCSLVQLKNNFNLITMYGSTYGYRTGLNASISISRSHINRNATDCTRPAEREPGNLRHSTGDKVKPTK